MRHEIIESLIDIQDLVIPAVDNHVQFVTDFLPAGSLLAPPSTVQPRGRGIWYGSSHHIVSQHKDRPTNTTLAMVHGVSGWASVSVQDYRCEL